MNEEKSILNILRILLIDERRIPTESLPLIIKSIYHAVDYWSPDNYNVKANQEVYFGKIRKGSVDMSYIENYKPCEDEISSYLKELTDYTYFDLVKNEKFMGFLFGSLFEILVKDDIKIIEIPKKTNFEIYLKNLIEEDSHQLEITKSENQIIYDLKTQNSNHLEYKQLLNGWEQESFDLLKQRINLVTYYLKDEHKERRTIAGATLQNQGTSGVRDNTDFPDHIKRVLDLYRVII